MTSIYEDVAGRREYNWQHIKEMMKVGVVRITFKKVSTGELRVLDATLAEYLLPETGNRSQAVGKDPDVVTVFDLDKNHWRAFRKETVTDVEVLDGCKEEG